MGAMKTPMKRVQKSDFVRVVLTETAAFDVPVTFSNTGFYWHLKKMDRTSGGVLDIVNFLFNSKPSDRYTIPLSYKIRKDSTSHRTLALMHPSTQVDFVEFYRVYGQQILDACKHSNFSIRSPASIASKYYLPNTRESKYKFRSDDVVTGKTDRSSKFLTSYFSYRGYARLHHFFDSPEFLSLERRYSSFWSIDVAKCFDSIYTHTITWALKSRPFSKQNASVKSSFGQMFDMLMQKSNYNETAGILIGSEVSRIFAEVIFQRIDKNVEVALGPTLIEGVDYTIRRYVDDIYVFAKSDEAATKIIAVLRDELKIYKMSLNDAKTIKASRPFITDKSKALHASKAAMNRLRSQLITPALSDAVKPVVLVPRRVINRHALIRGFLSEVKSACLGVTSAYEMVSGYLISALCNLARDFVESSSGFCPTADELKAKYEDLFSVIVDLVFHFYTLNPSQGASVKICIATQQICTYIDSAMPERSSEIKGRIYALSCDFFESAGFGILERNDSDKALLEALNLLVTVKSLGPHYFVPPNVIQRIVGVAPNRKLSYFEITCLLFYIGHDPSNLYKKVKQRIVRDITQHLHDLSDLRVDAQKAYLLLDVLACPFIEEKLRRRLISNTLKTATQRQPSDDTIAATADDFLKHRWFTSWTTIDLFSTLEKKALLKSY
jgi:hypothetical protein